MTLPEREEFESEAERLFDSIDGWIDLGNYDEAAEELHRPRPPFKSTVHFVKAWIRIYVAQKAWSNVQLMCETLLRHAPDDPKGYLQLAEAFHDQGKHADAIATLSQALESGPLSNSSEIRYHLARYLSAAGQLDEARKCLTKAIEADRSLRRNALDDSAFEKLWLESQGGV